MFQAGRRSSQKPRQLVNQKRTGFGPDLLSMRFRHRVDGTICCCFMAPPSPFNELLIIVRGDAPRRTVSYRHWPDHPLLMSIR
jgi:hypothetical protein